MENFDKITQQLEKIKNLPENWDGEGGKQVREEVIHSTQQFLDLLYLCRRPGGCGFLNNLADTDGYPSDPIPHDVYLLPNGSLLLEWQYPNYVIERIEISEPGRGEVMITYPGKANIDAEFRTINW